MAGQCVGKRVQQRWYYPWVHPLEVCVEFGIGMCGLYVIMRSAGSAQLWFMYMVTVPIVR